MKLSKEEIQGTLNSPDTNDNGDRQPMPEGIYPVTLTNIGRSDNPGASGYHYLRVELTVQKGSEAARRKLFSNISFSPKAGFRLREFYTAVGVNGDEDIDTEDLLGRQLRANVGVEVLQQGSRAGELANFVKSLLPPLAVAAGVAGNDYNF